MTRGGPAFSTIDGVEYLVGIARSGDPGCVMFARHTRIDPFVARFIARFIARSAEGAAEAGDTCYYMENCTSRLCISAPDDPRIHYCSRACASSADCPLDMSCQDSGTGLSCVLPAPTPGALGAACEVDGECEDRACARIARAQPLACSHPCQGPEDRSCAASQYCGPTFDDPGRYVCSSRPATVAARPRVARLASRWRSRSCSPCDGAAGMDRQARPQHDQRGRCGCAPAGADRGGCAVWPRVSRRTGAPTAGRPAHCLRQ